MDVAYVAVEVGQWSLPDGQMMAAGVVNTNALINSDDPAGRRIAERIVGCLPIQRSADRGQRHIFNGRRR